MNPTVAAPICPAGMDCTMTSQDWVAVIALLVLFCLPMLVLPGWAARNVWRIRSLLKRLVVMNAALPMLLLIPKVSNLIKPNLLVSMRGNVTFPDFLWELAALSGPYWIASLIVGILFAYAATVVLFVLPNCRFRRWVFAETDLMFGKGEIYRAEIAGRTRQN